MKEPKSDGIPTKITTLHTILFCVKAGHNPPIDPKSVTNKLLPAATKGSIPKKVIIGTLTTPNAIPTHPPIKPIKREENNNTNILQSSNSIKI